MNEIQIEYIEYSPSTKSLDVFTIGCYGSCKNCCNPEIKNWELQGMSVDETLDKLIRLNTQFGDLIEKIIIVGGDPIDGYKKYPKSTLALLQRIKKGINKPIFLFTRHNVEDIPQDILDVIDYVKTGAYIPELATEDNIQYGIKLATSNQKIYKL